MKKIDFKSLDEDCLRSIAARLSPRDLLRLVNSFKGLRFLADNELYWELQCALLFRHPAYPALYQETPAHFLRHSGLSTFAELYKALYMLRCWPEGVWRQLDDWVQPVGRLWHAQVTGPNLRLGMRAFKGSPSAGGPPPPEPIFEVAYRQGREPPFALICDPVLTTKPALPTKPVSTTSQTSETGSARPKMPAYLRRPSREHAPAAAPDGDAAPMKARGSPAGERSRLSVRRRSSEENGGGVVVETRAGTDVSLGNVGAFLERLWFVGAVTRWQPSLQKPTRLSLIPILGDDGSLQLIVSYKSQSRSLLTGSAKWQQVRLQYEGQGNPVHLPVPLQLLPPRPGPIELLSRLQGLWYSLYGPHGLETLNVRMAGLPPGESGQDLRVCGPRLTAMKIVGDRNVPSGKCSFVADASECQLGPWDGSEPGRENRIIYSTPAIPLGNNWLIVDLSARRILARFRSWGQINEVPLVWNPKTVGATVIIYEEEEGPLFSVLWDDEDRMYRHIMDFRPSPLQARRSLTAPTNGSV